MNNIIANIRTQLQKLKCRIANLSNRVTYIEDNCCNGGGSIEQDNIFRVVEVSLTELGLTTDATESEIQIALANYIESLNINVEDDEVYVWQVTGYTSEGSGGIQTITAGANIIIDDTDPQNPVISSTGELQDLQSVLETGGEAVGKEVLLKGEGTGWQSLLTVQDSRDPSLVANAQFGVQQLSTGMLSIGTFVRGTTTLTNNLFYGNNNFQNLTPASADATTFNTAIGVNALRYITGGSGRNTALGHQAGNNTSTGGYNTFIGQRAGNGNTTGSNNTLIGQDSYYNITVGSGNTVVGRLSSGLPNNLVNNIILANGVGGVTGIGFRVFEDGTTVIPLQTNTNIDNDTTGKAVITKEYFDANSGGSTPNKERFTGDTVAAKVLTQTPITNSVSVILNGVELDEQGGDYTVTTNTITLASAPLTTDVIVIKYIY